MCPDVLLATSPSAEQPPFAEVYKEHAAFVWRSLRRLGVRPADLEDVTQETFVIVHAKLATFRGGSMKSWLFAIAVRVAADYRKRAHVRRELTTDAGVVDAEVPEGQSEALERARAREVLQSILMSLDDDKRAIFVAYELDGMPMSEVAAALECPVQTAYSRLHAARAEVSAGIERYARKGGKPR